MSTAVATILAPPAAPPAAPTVLPLIEDKHAECYKYRLEGKKLKEIAQIMGVDIATCSRWCRKYEQQFRETMEGETPADLISRELVRLDDVEDTARRLLQNSKSDRARAGYLAEIRRTIGLRARLMMDTGLIPREPTQLFKVIATLRPRDMGDGKPGAPRRSKEELVAHCLELLEKTPVIAE